MAGKKGRSGGARVRSATAQRPGPLLRRITVGKETAREIKIAILARGLPYTPENVAKIVGEWSHAAWIAYDAEITREAEAEAWNGEVL